MPATKAKETPRKATTRKIATPKMSVSEANIGKSAARLLSTKLVSTEIAYVQRTLGNTATQQELDAKILAVRSMPWENIVLPE